MHSYACEQQGQVEPKFEKRSVKHGASRAQGRSKGQQANLGPSRSTLVNLGKGPHAHLCRLGVTGHEHMLVSLTRRVSA